VAAVILLAMLTTCEDTPTGSEDTPTASEGIAKRIDLIKNKMRTALAESSISWRNHRISAKYRKV
jgi:hypothetical protein